jgi:membrane-associated protease RseP (regulator of RpoE activity)
MRVISFLMLAAIAGGSITLAGCGPTTQGPQLGQAEIGKEAEFQRRLYVENRVKQVRRVANISYRLRHHAVALCKERTRHEFGVVALNSRDAKGRYATAMTETLKLGANPRIISVAVGSPAEAAGLQVGDEIISVDGKTLPYGTRASKALPEMLKKSGATPVKFAIDRAGTKMDITVTPTLICRYPVHIVDKDQINAFADGEQIVITTGMLRFAHNDTELGLVIAHELAHNVMGHIDKRKGNAAGGAAVGLVFDVLAALAGVNTGGAFSRLGAQAGAGSFSKSFEAEADYVGLYLMARAGMDYRAAPDFWRRMSTINPKSISHASTHPVTPARFLLLKKTIAEIKEKQAKNLALEPNRKTPFSPSDAGGANGFRPAVAD